MTRYLTFLFLLFALCGRADGVQDRVLDAVLDSSRTYQRATQIAKISRELAILSQDSPVKQMPGK